MAEQDAPEESTAVAAPSPDDVLTPEEINSDIIDELIIGPTPEAEEAEVAPPPAPSRAEEKAPDDNSERIERLENVLSVLAQRANQPAPQPEVDPSAKFDERNTELDPEGKRWFKESVETLTDPKITQLQKQVEQLKGVMVEEQQRGVVSQFNQELNSMMTDAGISEEDTYTRLTMRHAVTNEATQRHGQQLQMGHVKAIFRDLNNQRVKKGHVAEGAYVETKNAEEQATPPIAAGKSSSSAAESVKKELLNPSNRKMDFRGDHFNKIVNGLLNRTEKVADKVVGARRK